MTIGEALKETRKSLGLSQTEMAYPVLTKSYYSKIERGIHEINASDLIKILEMHHIDISDFFVKCGVEDEKIDEEQWMAKLRQAYYAQDLYEVKKLKEKLIDVKSDSHTKKILEAIVILSKANINRNINNLSKEIKSNIKSLIFETEDWNEENLRLLSMSLPLWSDEEFKPIIRSLLKKYIMIEQFPGDIQILVSSIMVNYLSYTIRTSSENLELAKNIFVLLDRLPIEPTNCFGKIMKNFYQAYFENDDKKIQSILKFFRDKDMKKIAEILKVSI